MCNFHIIFLPWHWRKWSWGIHTLHWRAFLGAWIHKYVHKQLTYFGGVVGLQLRIKFIVHHQSYNTAQPPRLHGCHSLFPVPRKRSKYNIKLRMLGHSSCSREAHCYALYAFVMFIDNNSERICAKVFIPSRTLTMYETFVQFHECWCKPREGNTKKKYEHWFTEITIFSGGIGRTFEHTNWRVFILICNTEVNNSYTLYRYRKLGKLASRYDIIHYKRPKKENMNER